jgi:hypothetical protein
VRSQTQFAAPRSTPLAVRSAARRGARDAARGDAVGLLQRPVQRFGDVHMEDAGAATAPMLAQAAEQGWAQLGELLDTRRAS